MARQSVSSVMQVLTWIFKTRNNYKPIMIEHVMHAAIIGLILAAVVSLRTGMIVGGLGMAYMAAFGHSLPSFS